MLNIFRSHRQIAFTRRLSDQEAKENDQFIIEAEVSVPDRIGVWLKDGKVIEAGQRVEMSTDGCTYRLVIKDTLPDDQGLYSLLVDYAKSSAQITMKGFPS